MRKLYPTVGSSVNMAEGENVKEEHIAELGNALQRLPRVHLLVLDAIVSHLKKWVYDCFLATILRALTEWRT